MTRVVKNTFEASIASFGCSEAPMGRHAAHQDGEEGSDIALEAKAVLEVLEALEVRA